jgi:serine protease Do
VEQLIENGYVSGRPTLGIHCEVLSSMYQHYYRLPDGLYINGVDRGSPAAEAGIAKGDVIVSINNMAITDMETYNAFLYSQKVGETVTMEIYRSGKYYTVRLTFAQDQG